MRMTRILYEDNGTISDWSTSLNNYYTESETFSLVAAEDYIYIGMPVPFNHFFVKLSTPSTAVSTITMQYYTGREFQDVVETIDETNGFQQDGFITFVPDKKQGWVRQDTSGTGGTITELSSVTIYDKYWARIKFSADLDASSVISWIGHKFSDDDQLGSEFPDLTRSTMIAAFESGKTNWEEQHVRAANIIIEDLIRQQVIHSKGQILERRSFSLASVSKVAEIIFNSFGDDYEDNKRNAQIEYEKRMNKSIFDIDLNEDGRLDVSEQRLRQGFMSR